LDDYVIVPQGVDRAAHEYPYDRFRAAPGLGSVSVTVTWSSSMRRGTTLCGFTRRSGSRPRWKLVSLTGSSRLRILSELWTNGKPATKSVTVGEWKEIARTVSHDGKHRMIVMLTPNNLFRFFEDTLITESMPLGPLTYWSPSHMSGLYASAEDAEKAACMELSWLRISN